MSSNVLEKVREFAERRRQEDERLGIVWAGEEETGAEAAAEAPWSSGQGEPATWTTNASIEETRAQWKARKEKMVDLAGLCIMAGTMGNLNELKQVINQELDKIIGKRSGRKLPPPVAARDLQAQRLPPPPQIVEGVLHMGSKMVFGGNSKAFKTWQLLHLALAVSSGTEWQGHKTGLSSVLYINLELEAWAMSRRLAVLQESLGLNQMPENLRVWNLRDELTTLEDIIEDAGSDQERCGLVVVDPIYSLLTGKDEIGTEAVSQVCALLGVLGKTTGAAVVWGAHYAKGNSASKAHIDRISGSGVWARNPDTIMTATEHEHAGCYAVEITCRNLPSPPPYVIEWQYPLFVRKAGLNPANLKQKSGRASTYKPEDILPHLPPAGATASQWCKTATAETGMTRSTFYRLLGELKDDARIRKANEVWGVVP